MCADAEEPIQMVVRESLIQHLGGRKQDIGGAAANDLRVSGNVSPVIVQWQSWQIKRSVACA